MEAPLMHLALVGTPNSGKTALFNALTGSRQKVANYPGVTVERKEGSFVTPLVIMAVSEDRKGENVIAPFLRKLRLSNLTIYLDPETKALGAFGSDALPTTVLIDRNGREIGRLFGAASWDSAAARRLIDRLLSPTPPDSWSAQR